MGKNALVSSGGGMACAYGVGVGEAVQELSPDFLQDSVFVGSSGSTGMLAYYTANRRKYSRAADIFRPIRHIWEDLLSTPKFISFLRLQKIIDIDYLIDEVFRGQEPLNVEDYHDSPIECFIAATDVKTGLPRHFSNRCRADIFEVLRASSAIPIVYGKEVAIEDSTYIDGGIAAGLDVNVRFAREHGAGKILAIDNSNGGWASLALMHWYAARVNQVLRKTVREYCKDPCPLPPEDPSVFLLKPSQKLPCSTLGHTREAIHETIEMGRADVINNPRLREFLLGTAA